MAPTHSITRRRLLQAPLAMAAAAAGTPAMMPIPAAVAELEIASAPPSAFPSVSAGLAEAIAAHRTSSAAFLALCDLTDEIATGRVPTAREMRRLDRALHRDGNLLHALCGYPCQSDADQQAKADYLLGLLDTSDMPRECTLALLTSMQGAEAPPHRMRDPSGNNDRSDRFTMEAADLVLS